MRVPGHMSRSTFGRSSMIDRRQQVHGDDVGLADVGLEQVLQLEDRAVADARLLGVGAGLLDTHRIEIDAERTRAVLGGRGHRDAAVTRAEIDVIFAGPDLAELQHPVDDLLRRRDVGNVEPGLRAGR